MLFFSSPEKIPEHNFLFGVKRGSRHCSYSTGSDEYQETIAESRIEVVIKIEA
jgi:hypothetical protein